MKLCGCPVGAKGAKLTWKSHKRAVKDLKSTKMIVSRDVVRVSGTTPGLPPSQFRQLITHDLKKMYRNWCPQWHQGCNRVVLVTDDYHVK